MKKLYYLIVLAANIASSVNVFGKYYNILFGLNVAIIIIFIKKIYKNN